MVASIPPALTKASSYLRYILLLTLPVAAEWV